MEIMELPDPTSTGLGTVMPAMEGMIYVRVANKLLYVTTDEARLVRAGLEKVLREYGLR